MAELHLWLSSRRLPRTGGVLAMSVLNFSSNEFRYSLQGSVEFAGAEGWAGFARFGSTLDQSGLVGEVQPHRKLARRLIAVVAPSLGTGPIEFVRIPELPIGRYRLSHCDVSEVSGLCASGEFVLGDGMPLPGPVGKGRAAGAWLCTEPTVVPNGNTNEVTIRAFASGDDMGNSSYAPLDGHFRDTVDLEEWHETGWTRVNGPLTVAGLVDACFGSRRETVTIPRLPEGTYRLLRNHAELGDLEGVFWVIPDHPKNIALPGATLS